MMDDLLLRPDAVSVLPSIIVTALGLLLIAWPRPTRKPAPPPVMPDGYMRGRETVSVRIEAETDTEAVTTYLRDYGT